MRDPKIRSACRIVPPGVAVRVLPGDLATASVPCSCSLDTAALFPDGPPSPPLPLSHCELHELLLALPRRLQNSPWRVCYDTEQDGFSLHNFYRVMKKVHEDCESGIGVFVVNEGVSASLPSTPVMMSQVTPTRGGGTAAVPATRDIVLGCFTPEVPCLEHSQHAFFGTPDTFVFTYADMNNYAGNKRDNPIGGGKRVGMQRSGNSNMSPCASPLLTPERVAPPPPPPVLSTYPWAMEEANREFMICANNFFGVGGGRDGAAIFVDENLLHGSSSVHCVTFASPSLTGRARATLRHSEFTILRMVWFRLKERRCVFTCMNLPTREPCDCGKFLDCGCGRGNRVARLRSGGAHGVNRNGWHVCSDDEQPIFYTE
ncbi:hypothetical protein DQ04_01581110 [Trypanosoma grayi]|uniref:hypothetical protein n=1 Tax=Trypanosoma grayi TaxID=71804 RepID=UPI0004F4AF4F|nr:hypothetical protein DQ04_01581110 [Trypanosoma grayi]KEG12614.1 hypothetical protein DQ04_01581110 [Trypanosoma grayi]